MAGPDTDKDESGGGAGDKSKRHTKRIRANERGVREDAESQQEIPGEDRRGQGQEGQDRGPKRLERQKNPHYHPTIAHLMAPWIQKKGMQMRVFGRAFGQKYGSISIKVPENRCTGMEIMGVCAAGECCKAREGAHEHTCPMQDTEAMELAEQLRPVVEEGLRSK